MMCLTIILSVFLRRSHQFPDCPGDQRGNLVTKEVPVGFFVGYTIYKWSTPSGKHTKSY